MQRLYDRREACKQIAGALLGGALLPAGSPPHVESAPAEGHKGCVVGEPLGARAGLEVLVAGGNAVDAAVTAALVAGVVAIPSCGIGGYGGHMVLALAGKKVTAIDFNSAAPAAARADLFPLDRDGKVKGQINARGWLASGVPGTLAGLQLALDRYGTLSFRKAIRPALRYAHDGFPVSPGLASAIRRNRTSLAKDPATARLLLPDGAPPAPGSTFRNPDLARLLETLAKANSVEPFYRGDVARRIAAAFWKNRGLVTAEDLAAYHAREVEPLTFTWRGYTVRTAPLTAGGASVLEMLGVLRELGWERLDPDDPKTLHARLEAQRLAWHDRLRYFGDPAKVKVPLDRLLSDAHARRLAGRVKAAIRAGKPAAAEADGRAASGTVHISAADARGNLVALTLTHGEYFGAQVTVDGLGLLLGQGMSRFDPRPGRPNSPGPGKRPLHNMCPTVVLRGGRPVLAVGAHGGRRIPNTILDVLARYVGRDLPMAEAVAAPRLHTEGGLDLTLEPKWPKDFVAYLKKAGYKIKTGPGATVGAVSFDPKSGACRTASR